MGWDRLVNPYTITALDGVAYGLLLFVIAAGLTLIFGVAGVFSMAHGTLYLAGAYLAWHLADDAWTGLALALGVALAVGVLGGAGLAAAVRPLTDRPLDQVLATLGIAYIAADQFSLVFGAEPRMVDPPRAVAGSVGLGDYQYPVYRLGFIAVGLAMVVGMFWLVERSRTGAVLRAVVADPGMAAATGLRTGIVRTGVMVGGGVLAVTAGVLGAPVIGPAPGVDTTILVYSLIVCVVGGLGSIRGALLAALGVGQALTLGVALVPGAAAFLLAAAMLAALTIRQRTALPGRPA
ncbi:branched-chain amino acid ABC transporter permease [Micromonospora craniellae]|uniref:Branched-chain amino acid ABC transporter permease n=1 Tax=Micromonospora craniellae TaxID=2294034 RepID=A0A372FRQ7_9ACTN|nr:branched-chain amino acid ABC transporter permease [Micromonospora craniellae]QOC94404.1 branched-chain amino acid ABC transporter permease [Micromonospora craniellae]RFS43190.1 branched-chain amino acid ABC transporter permease [Micromonospora craniellae]